MSDRQPDPEIRSALWEFQQYLSDKLAPLMVADDMALLLKHPAQLVAAEIHGWVGAQYRGHGASIPFSDYLYHAMKKVHAMGEFKLVPHERLQTYLAELGEILLQICPEADRPTLRQNIAMLSHANVEQAAPVEIVHRQAGSESTLAVTTRAGQGAGGVMQVPVPVGGVQISPEAALGLDRFARLMERYASAAPAGIPPLDLQTQLVADAVTSSNSPAELDAYLLRAREVGIDTQPRKLFRILSEALPPWAVPMSLASQQMEDVTAGPIEAMHKMILMAEGEGEGARRFREMVRAAIDQFNEGSLARAVTMLELAERIVDEKHVAEAEVRSARSVDHEHIDAERLKKQVEARDSHYLLRKFLTFFNEYQLDSMFNQLAVEPKREKRRAILAMLEVYGNDARSEALNRLEALIATKPEGETHYVARNLAYVLNHIPRTDEADLDKEIDVLGGLSSTSYKPIVVKEAIATLAQTKHERTEKILATRLHDLETMLLAPGMGRYTAQEAKQLIDRIIASLGRVGTPGALNSIVDHGLKTHEQFGDARARLSAISTHDLSSMPHLVDRLIESVRSELPRKMLGIKLQKKSTHVGQTLEAFRSTPAPLVRQLLEEIVSKYREYDFSEVARSVLEAHGATVRAAPPAPQAPTLQGDLEVFGLPNLLQNLAELQSTGVLSLIDQEDHSISSITLEKGRILKCQHGSLVGKDALFQIFERSRPATFSFVTRAEEETPAADALDIPPLIFEALRRHDELHRAKLLIPPSAILEGTGAKPQPHPKENDPHLVRDVWVKATSGVPPAKWAHEMNADSYRVWRLLEHWVDSGALKVHRD